MYDKVVKSYIRGEVDRETCVKMMWTMGATRTEVHFYLEEADRQRANNVEGNDEPTYNPVCMDGK